MKWNEMELNSMMIIEGMEQEEDDEWEEVEEKAR